MPLQMSFLYERMSKIPHNPSELRESTDSERSRKGRRFTGSEHRKLNAHFMIVFNTLNILLLSKLFHLIYTK